jgi:hypothetical protein
MDIYLLKDTFLKIAGYFLNNIFHEDKRHFPTGERALFVWGLGGLGPPCPRRFLRPCLLQLLDI